MMQLTISCAKIIIANFLATNIFFSDFRDRILNSKQHCLRLPSLSLFYGTIRDLSARRRNLSVLKAPIEANSIFGRVVFPRPPTAPHLWSHCALNKATAVNCPGFNERRIPAVTHRRRLSAGVRHQIHRLIPEFIGSREIGVESVKRTVSRHPRIFHRTEEIRLVVPGALIVDSV